MDRRVVTEAAISKLKDEPDCVILVAGSGRLVTTLQEPELVDELCLIVCPTLLGRRMFPDGIDRLQLRLAESRERWPGRRSGANVFTAPARLTGAASR